MTWIYKQATGDLFHNGKYVASGYSGRDWAKNNPEAERARAVGPIPRGKWRIGVPYESKNTGPYTIPLTAQDGKPDDVHQPTGRSAFRIHGDSIRNPGTASHGCIILSRSIRQKIWASGDKDLEVIS